MASKSKSKSKSKSTSTPRYRFDYEVGSWVNTTDSLKKKPVKEREFSEEKLLKAYIRVASKNGCLLDIIKYYMPWIGKEDLMKNISAMKKNCMKNGYRLIDIPVKPIKVRKKKKEHIIDYEKSSKNNPLILVKHSDHDSDGTATNTSVSDNRKAYKAALDEHIRRLSEDEEYKKWHEGMTKEESRKAFQEEFMSRREPY